MVYTHAEIFFVLLLRRCNCYRARKVVFALQVEVILIDIHSFIVFCKKIEKRSNSMNMEDLNRDPTKGISRRIRNM
ncbi:hypothetical protein RIF29_14104 [Crotalaria pallida]|uniref:Uncharacterized protein n=1 Tax=Crotalaria pallida TaxID=3830 RepID=A0AAN9FGW4_CROPI